MDKELERMRTAVELELSALRIRRAQAEERAQAQQRAAHQRQMEQIRRRVARDQAAARDLARLRALGVAATDRRIQRIDVRRHARQLGVDV